MSDNHGDDHPDAIAARDALVALSSQLFAAVEYGIDCGRDYFGELPLDPWLFPHIVRHRVLEYLEPRADAGGFVVTQNPMSGIEAECSGYQVRLFKKCGTNAEFLYPPGHSQGRQDFYSQQMSIPGTEHLIATLSSPNVAYIWEAQADGLELWLVCPDGFEGIWKPGRVRWSTPIDHPALTMSPDHDFSFGADDEDLLEPLDVTGSDDPDDEA